MKRVWMFILVLIFMTSVIVPATLAYAKSKTAPVATTPTLAQLEAKYKAAANSSQKVRILIVPGHEPGFGGAEYQGIYERDLTVQIGDQLAAYLRQNPRFQVIVARSDDAWNPDLQKYFDHNMNAIQQFVADRKEAFRKLVDKGKVTAREEGDDQVAHAAAPDDVALRLYGIDKWADENNIDLVVHIHLNDAPDHGPDEPGANSGFAVYVPDAQYGNAATSLPLGNAIAARLSSVIATSTMPIENKGVVEDQELIALGAYNTLSVPSTLIEYSYITEPRFKDSTMWPTVTNEYAYQTYLGLQDFFTDPVPAKYISASLPFTFTATSTLPATGTATPELYALQAGLHSLGLYPATAAATDTASSTPHSLTDCPIDGVMGACTTDALKAFQSSRELPVTGTIDEATASVLNLLFGSYLQ